MCQVPLNASLDYDKALRTGDLRSPGNPPSSEDVLAMFDRPEIHTWLVVGGDWLP